MLVQNIFYGRTTVDIVILMGGSPANASQSERRQMIYHEQRTGCHQIATYVRNVQFDHCYNNARCL